TAWLWYCPSPIPPALATLRSTALSWYVLAVEIQTQGLHERRSSKLALPYDTAWLTRSLVGATFSHVIQLLFHVCYTAHQQAPFRHVHTSQFCVYHVRSSLA